MSSDLATEIRDLHEQMSDRDALLARAEEIARIAAWFVGWVKDAGITPREAVMNVKAAEWLPVLEEFRSDIRKARETGAAPR